MNCYLCEEAPSPGGTRIHNMTADGICQGCGIGVCRRHGHRSSRTAFALLCLECGARAEQSQKKDEGVVIRSA
jgi:hypothetical protein